MTIPITPRDGQDAAVLRLAGELASILAGLPWVCVGGLMVRVLEAEAGFEGAWSTGDVDALMDVRTVSSATEDAARRPAAAGFTPEPKEDRLLYRFTRGSDVVDILAPDHLGPRASRRTVPPAETIEADGGRQALERRRDVELDVGGDRFVLPCPSLAGAIVMKGRVAASVAHRDGRAKHQRDLCRLLALVADPFATRDELSPRERAWLGQLAELRDPAHRAWSRIAGAGDGAAALEILGRP